MNFSLLHILKKDFQLCWRYLAAWWGLLLFRAYWIMLALGEILHPAPLPRYNPAAPDARSFHQLFMDWLPAYLMVVTYLNPILLGYIVSLVLKADSPIDEKALWRTRPVARQKMLRAKLLFLGFFGILVPCLIETFERLRFGFNAGECVRGFVETALIEAAWMSVIASAALLFQRTFTGVLTYVAIVIAGSNGCAVLVHFGLLNRDFVTRDFVTPHPGWLGIGTDFVFFTLAVATVLLLARQMYGGAPRLHGAKTLVGGLAVAGVVALLCRSLFFSGHNLTYPPDDNLKLVWHAQANDKNPLQANEIALSANVTTTANVKVATDNPDGVGYTIYGQLADKSLPRSKDPVLLLRKLHSSLSWPDTQDRPNQATFDNLSDNIGLIYSPAVYAAAGYGRLAWKTFDDSSTLPLAYPTGAELNRAKSEPAHWSGVLDCESGHLVKVADVLPRNDAHWREGNIQCGFNQDVYLSPSRGSKYTHHLFLFFMQYGPVDYLLEPAPPNDKTIQVFLLYNPRTQECIEANSDQPNNRTEPVPFFSVFYDTVREVDFDFSQPLDATGQISPNPTSDEDVKKWTSEARLIELRFEPDRRFSSTMTIDPFLVPKDDTPNTTAGK